jgi:hypothetical protein
MSYAQNENYTTPDRSNPSAYPGAPTKNSASVSRYSNDDDLGRLLSDETEQYSGSRPGSSVSNSRMPSSSVSRYSQRDEPEEESNPYDGQSASAYGSSSQASKSSASSTRYSSPSNYVSRSYGGNSAPSQYGAPSAVNENKSAAVPSASRYGSPAASKGVSFSGDKPSGYGSSAAASYKPSASQSYSPSAYASPPRTTSSSPPGAPSRAIKNGGSRYGPSKASASAPATASRYSASRSTPSNFPPLEHDEDSAPSSEDEKPDSFIEGLRQSRERNSSLSASRASRASKASASASAPASAVSDAGNSQTSDILSKLRESRANSRAASRPKDENVDPSKSAASHSLESYSPSMSSSPASSYDVGSMKKNMSASLSKKANDSARESLHDEKAKLRKLGLGITGIKTISGTNKAVIEVVTPLMNKALVMVNTEPGSLVYDSHGETLSETADECFNELLDKWNGEIVNAVGVYYANHGCAATVAIVAGEYVRHYYKYHSESHTSCCHACPVIDYNVMVDVPGTLRDVDAVAHNLIFAEKNYVIRKTGMAVDETNSFAFNYIRVIKDMQDSLNGMINEMAVIYSRMAAVQALETDAADAAKIRQRINETMDNMKDLSHVRHKYSSLKTDIDAIVEKQSKV